MVEVEDLPVVHHLGVVEECGASEIGLGERVLVGVEHLLPLSSGFRRDTFEHEVPPALAQLDVFTVEGALELR